MASDRHRSIEENRRERWPNLAADKASDRFQLVEIGGVEGVVGVFCVDVENMKRAILALKQEQEGLGERGSHVEFA